MGFWKYLLDRVMGVELRGQVRSRDPRSFALSHRQWRGVHTYRLFARCVLRLRAAAGITACWRSVLASSLGRPAMAWSEMTGLPCLRGGHF
jgi:hypothetical protein